MLHMPGRSHTGPLPPLTPEQEALRDTLSHHVHVLAGEIGERNLVRRPDALAAAAEHVSQALSEAAGPVRPQSFDVMGAQARNLSITIEGSDPSAAVVVVGGHYDSAPGTPGANDNATGAAAVIVLAERLRDAAPRRTVHLVAFVNEEPPWFTTEHMGSLRYARALAEDGVDVHVMLSLETMGYYSTAKGSQQYPAPFSWFYPNTGDFIGFVGNVRSRKVTRQAVRAFRDAAAFPSQGAAVPGGIDGVGWSDHWAFWQQGWRAVMVTDTAPFRYPHYHEASDTPDKVDYERLARVVDGLEAVVLRLAE